MTFLEKSLLEKGCEKCANYLRLGESCMILDEMQIEEMIDINDWDNDEPLPSYCSFFVEKNPKRLAKFKKDVDDQSIQTKILPPKIRPELVLDDF